MEAKRKWGSKRNSQICECSKGNLIPLTIGRAIKNHDEEIGLSFSGAVGFVDLDRVNILAVKEGPYLVSSQLNGSVRV